MERYKEVECRILGMHDNEEKYINIPLVYNTPLCDICHNPKVDIHHDEGYFCVHCWNKRTDPYYYPIDSKTVKCTFS